MLSQLRGEWYQARKSLAIKIAYVLTLGLSLLFGYNNTFSQELQQFYQESHQELNLYGAGSLINAISDSAFSLLFAGLFAGLFISSAFENRLLQEAVSYGKSRAKIFWAKMLVYFAIAVGISWLYWFGMSFAAFWKNGIGTAQLAGNFSKVQVLAGVLAAATLAYLSLFALCGLVAFLCRRSGVTIGSCIIGILILGNVLASLLPDRLLNIVNKTPLGLYTQVLSTDVSWGRIVYTSVLSLIWTAAICAAALWRFQKTELK